MGSGRKPDDLQPCLCTDRIAQPHFRRWSVDLDLPQREALSSPPVPRSQRTPPIPFGCGSYLEPPLRRSRPERLDLSPNWAPGEDRSSNHPPRRTARAYTRQVSVASWGQILAGERAQLTEARAASVSSLTSSAASACGVQKKATSSWTSRRSRPASASRSQGGDVAVLGDDPLCRLQRARRRREELLVPGRRTPSWLSFRWWYSGRQRQWTGQERALLEPLPPHRFPPAEHREPWQNSPALTWVDDRAAHLVDALARGGHVVDREVGHRCRRVPCRVRARRAAGRPPRPPSPRWLRSHAAPARPRAARARSAERVPGHLHGTR